MYTKIKTGMLVLCGALATIPTIASAHEAYVLNHAFFWKIMNEPPTFGVLEALKSQKNIHITLVIAGWTIVGLFLNFLFRKTALGRGVTNLFEKGAPYGTLFVRAAIAIAFFLSALSWSFLGPELPLTQMPFAELLRILLFATSICIGLGICTEIAAFVALIIFCIGFFSFGTYLITYLNYLGELFVLYLFGMRRWSVDALLFGAKKQFVRFRKYETTIVRIFYGIALVFAAISVKFLHPALTVQVVNQYNLTQFHWLFPNDPLLITFGAGVVETLIGLFIIIGFEMRLTVLVSLFYITLSLLYFRELVWPHLMLYGISFEILVQPETFTVDHLLFGKRKRNKERLTA